MMIAALAGCRLPDIDDREVSHAVLSSDPADSLLKRHLGPMAASHPGRSGVLPLLGSLDAFAARMVLINSAEQSLDVQYYIWRDDITGNLLLRALHDAARRGVRVRLLLDDNGVTGLDEKLAMLNAEPNAEVRLFNPFPFRTFKPLGFLVDFSRLNRRMHNKSLTIDGQVTIAGGRNVGDEYFGATQGVAFADLDVMVAGAVVDDVSTDFDRYWNSPSAYPAEALIDSPPPARIAELEAAYRHMDADVRAQTYVSAVATSHLTRLLMAGQLDFEWVPVRLVSDDPAKVLGKAPPESLVLNRIVELLEQPRQSVDLISPYFVPTEKGVEAFAALAAQGVAVRVLTNALEATDVAAVHAGYAKYREPLLEAGIALYEMQRESDPGRTREKAGPFGSSGSSLHAKTFSVDGERIFVGSFNFDPRSARLNTELGFVIKSPKLARAAARSFDENIPRDAYELGLDEDGDLHWIDRSSGEPHKLTREPATSWWRLAYVRFLSLLPIEGLL